jgi:hypothetical protein
MRLRREVPKIPAKSSVLPRLPLNKSASLLTRSESTLPQLLIPLHFNSSISNTYKKSREGIPQSNPKVLQLVTIPPPLLRTCRNARNPNPLYALLHNFWTPRGWGAYLSAGQPCMAVAGRIPDHGSRNTGHRPRLTGPQVPLRRNPQSARITGVTAWWQPGNISAPGGV